MPETDYELDVGEETATTSGLSVEEVRAAFEDHIHVSHDITGLLSNAEVRQQRQYVDSILRNPGPQDLKDLAESYASQMAEEVKAERLRMYHQDVVHPLKTAMSAGVISATSYREWIDWIRDPNRDATEKKPSIMRTLPDYLDKRYKLAAKRDALMRDKRFALLSSSNDPRIKAIAAKISDNEFYLESLSYEERKATLNDAINALPLAATEVKLFEGFEKELSKAVQDKLITEDSKGKWIARFKDPSVNIRAKEYFVESQFPSYVNAWRRVQKDRDTVMKDPLFKELTASKLPSIDVLKTDMKFLSLHYDKRTSLIAETRAAIKAHKERKAELLKETRSVLMSASSAGYISESKVGPWLEHVISGERTLKELKEFVKDWAKVRFRYDKIEQAMVHSRVPQGMQRLTASQFTNLSYQQRLSYVEEAERRFDMQKSTPGNTRIDDLKGKVRHALDSENWDEARRFLQQAWLQATSEEDMDELTSMQNYLKNFGEESGDENPEDNKMSAMRSAVEKMDAAFEEMPPEIKPFYREVLKKGNAGAVRCLGVLFYNVEWCLQRGYLPRDLKQVQSQASQDTQSRLEPAGPGHIDGAVEFNDIEQYGNAAISENRWGPNVMYASSGEASKIADSVDRNQNDFSYWYWGDLVVDGVSAGQYARLGLVTRKMMTQGAYALEALGEDYYSAKEQLALLN